MRLQITLDTRFDSIGHDELWKNNLANDLNLLMAYARASHVVGIDFNSLALSLVTRIAEFEEIRFI